MELASLIVVLAVALAVIFFIANSVRVIRQQRVGVVERLGKFKRTLDPGPHLVVPLFDKVRYNMDMRENVVPFHPRCDHRGQPDGQHRLGHLLPDHRPGPCSVRGPGLHQGDRAADYDHLAQHHRWA